MYYFFFLIYISENLKSVFRNTISKKYDWHNTYIIKNNTWSTRWGKSSSDGTLRNVLLYFILHNEIFKNIQY